MFWTDHKFSTLRTVRFMAQPCGARQSCAITSRACAGYGVLGLSSWLRLGRGFAAAGAGVSPGRAARAAGRLCAGLIPPHLSRTPLWTGHTTRPPRTNFRNGVNAGIGRFGRDAVPVLVAVFDA